MILRGQVVHRRHGPLHRRFIYPVFSLLLDLDELPRLGDGLRLFSHNRFNLFSFHDRDHGPRRDAPLRPWLEALLRAQGIELEGGRVRVLCFPRVLGYVFNPLSVWYCHHADGSLRAVLCEVSNTFGERHSYLLHEHGRPLANPVRQERDKCFYVSPFIPMQARYRFHIALPGERVAVNIRERTPDGPLLDASLTGRLEPLSDRRLAAAFLRYPLLTMQVMARIHWQALKLWLRGAPRFRRPPPPHHEVTP